MITAAGISLISCSTVEAQAIRFEYLGNPYETMDVTSADAVVIGDPAPSTSIVTYSGTLDGAPASVESIGFGANASSINYGQYFGAIPEVNLTDTIVTPEFGSQAVTLYRDTVIVEIEPGVGLITNATVVALEGEMETVSFDWSTEAFAESWMNVLPATQVPEPSGMVLLGIGGMLLLLRRRAR